MNFIVYAFPTVVIFGLAMFFLWYMKSVAPKKQIDEKKPSEKRTGKGVIAPRMERKPGNSDGGPFCLSGRRYPLEKKDALPLIILTVVYAVFAFLNLGDMKAPQTFLHFDKSAASLTIDLGATVKISKISYYTGLWTGNYCLEISQDGYRVDIQSNMEQEYSNLFKWQDVKPVEHPYPARYIRLTADANELELGEIAIYDENGYRVSPEIFTYDRPDGEMLFDEQEMVPDTFSYMNSTYFDEIYHARTAYEHLRNIYPYEISHPPLGKLIIMQGIKLFGMTPFGYRFMGAFFGVLMLPFLYALIKYMFGKSQIAFLGTALFAFDFMHYVQTRIATIDVYGVFFILLMYFFMFRYLTVDYEKPVKRQLLELFLCGLCFGIGAASKWISIYAGAGLAALYVINLALRFKYYVKRKEHEEISKYFKTTVLCAVLFFIVIPAFLYCASYYPYWSSKGASITDKDMIWDIDEEEYILKNIAFNEIWSNQRYMLDYHTDVNDEHPYSSKWWEWLVNARPILYYLDYPGEGVRMTFGSFNNPIVSWGGLLSLVLLFFRIKGNKMKPLIWFIIIGYLSQFLPWLFIMRTTFAYHYFPSVIFLVLAICFVFHELYEAEPPKYKRNIFAFTGAAIVLFIMFYPGLSGILTPEWYFGYFLRWFPSWPF